MGTEMHRPTIYLCGPIADRTDEQCKDWRERARSLFAGVCLDPMRRDYRGVFIDKELAAKIVQDDLEDIDNSDGLLVMFDKPSVGTSMEIFYAHSTGKKIVLIDVSGRSPESMSPWLVNHVDYITTNFLDGLNKIGELTYGY